MRSREGLKAPTEVRSIQIYNDGAFRMKRRSAQCVQPWRKASLGQHERPIVEVPKDLIELRQSELANENPREKAIALDLARRAALATFPTGAERILHLYDEGAPVWCEDRPHVMNEQPCDHEENGTRAWKIVWVRVRAPYETFRLDMKRRSINFFETPLLPVPAYLADATEVLQLCSHAAIGWLNAPSRLFGLRSIQMASI